MKSMQKSGPIPVLLTVRELNQGGIERDVGRVATHLDRSRFAPHVASFHAHGMRYQELRTAGIPVFHLAVKSTISLGALWQAWRLFRYLRRHRIQLVHAWDTTAVLVIPVAWLARTPAILSSVLGYRDLIDQRSRQLWRQTDRLVKGIVVNCEAMRRHVIEDEGARVRVELCYNGVDTKQFYPAPERPTEARPVVIGAICVLRPEKALHLLQEAFARMRKLNPGTACKLMVVGSGPELERLQANAVQLGITEDSSFIPATSQVTSYLHQIDIFVLCSYSEAFSNALLESMACGCCPVGSRVGGTPEMLGENGERGLLFQNGDAGDLAEKLARLMGDPALRQSLARSAEAYARETLNMENNARRTEEIYDSFLGRSSS